MKKWCLVVTVVRKGWGDKVIEASLKTGAEGATICLGRGTGIHERQKLLGIPIEPEKEIVFSVVHPNMSEPILQAIVEECELEKPGAGIAFVVPVERVVGISHLLAQNGGEPGA